MKDIIDKLKKVMSNKYVLIGVMVFVVLIIVLLVGNNDYLAFGNGDTGKFINEYEELNDKESTDGRTYPSVDISSNNNIKYININEALDILKDGTAAIYIGYAECIYCRSAVQVLMDTAEESDIDSVYYLDISDIWDIKELNKDNKVVTKQEAHDRYDELLEELGDEYTEEYILTNEDGEQINTEERRVSVPLVIFVVNGDIVSSNVGTLFSQTDPYTPLNEDQVKGLSEIYSYGLRDVVNGLNNK